MVVVIHMSHHSVKYGLCRWGGRETFRRKQECFDRRYLSFIDSLYLYLDRYWTKYCKNMRIWSLLFEAVRFAIVGQLDPFILVSPWRCLRYSLSQSTYLCFVFLISPHCWIQPEMTSNTALAKNKSPLRGKWMSSNYMRIYLMGNARLHNVLYFLGGGG